VAGLLTQIGHFGGTCGADRLSRAAYSGLFMLRYNQGFADTLGGGAEFWRIVSGQSSTAGTAVPASAPGETAEAAEATRARVS
jgi:hypothetical protein